MSDQAARDIFVQANGIRHHLIGRGSPGNPVVMMIHGLAGQAHTFDAVAAHLAQKYHVYCLDVRGRGESEWGRPGDYHLDTYLRDLEATRDALGIRRFSLVGTSMGGAISMNYAATHADIVAKVVLNDMGPEIDPAGMARIREYVGNAPDAFPNMKAVVEYYRKTYGPMIVRLPDDQVEAFARWNVRKNDMGVFVWKMDPAIRQFPQPDSPPPEPWDVARKVTCPTLVIRGALSDVLSKETASRMVDEMPNAELIEVAGVGHAPLLVETEAVEALDRFLAA